MESARCVALVLGRPASEVPLMQSLDGKRQAGLQEADEFGYSAAEKRLTRLHVQFYGAMCAFLANPEVESSLATCEQLHKADAVPDFSDDALSGLELEPREYQALDVVWKLGVEDVDRAARLVSTALEAPSILRYALACDSDRQAKIVGLLEAGQISWAKRMAMCGRQAVELGCGDCGAKTEQIITCDVRLCEDCQNRKLGQLVGKYEDRISSWADPTFYTFTIENVSDPVKGRDAVTGAFGRFRRRKVPVSGATVREGAEKRWCWWRDGGRPSERWRTKLMEAGKDDLARRFQREYVDQNKGIPMDELLQSGVYSVDVKQIGPDDFNVHLHVLADAHYVPQAALASVWEDVSGAPVMDVRRIYQHRGGETVSSALMETMAYASKPPEFEELGDEIEYLAETKGSRAAQTFGRMHGNAPEADAHLCCSECEAAPSFWSWLGVVDVVDGVVLDAEADRPPDV